MQTAQINKVIKYYDSTVIDYMLLWTGSKDLAMHYGYYDDKTRNHLESLLKMNKVLSEFVRIYRNDEVLDAGCGYGGSAIWLAKNIGCKVAGLNIVPFQIERAKQFAREQGVADLVSFHNEDYAHTSFSSTSFDVV